MKSESFLCPKCDSENVEESPAYVDGELIDGLVDAKCLDCGHTFLIVELEE